MTSWLEAVWLCGDAIFSCTFGAGSRALRTIKKSVGARMAMIAIMASPTTASRLQKRSGRWVGATGAATPDGLPIRAVGAALLEIVSTAVFTWLTCW